MYKYQTYKNKELIIVDDSSKHERNTIVNSWKPYNITYIHLPRNVTIGEKRNIAIKHSKGNYIAIWDDDDFHGKQRLQMQMKRIRDGHGIMTCVKNVRVNLGAPIFTKASSKSKICVPIQDQSKVYIMPKEEQAKLWYKSIINNSLLFPKVLWEIVPFPNQNIAEDSIKGIRLNIFIVEGLFANQKSRAQWA